MCRQIVGLVLFACQLVSYGYVTVQKTDDAIQDVRIEACSWIENVAPSPNYAGKAALYEAKGYLKFASIDALKKLHRQEFSTVAIQVPFIDRFGNGTVMLNQSNPLARYLGLMRLYYADEDEMDLAWDIDTSSKSKSHAHMFSFHNEHKALDIAQSRIRELLSDDFLERLNPFPQDSLDKGPAKFMLLCLLIFCDVAQQVLNETEHASFSEVQRQSRRMRKNLGFKDLPKSKKNPFGDPFAQSKVYIEGLLSYHNNLIRRSIQGAVLARAKELPQQLAGDTIEAMLIIYMNETVAPFLNFLLLDDARADGPGSKASLIARRQSTETHDSDSGHQLLVIERRASSNYSEIATNDKLFSLQGVAGKFKLRRYNSLKYMYSVKSDETDFERYLQNRFGWGSFSKVAFQCVEFLRPVSIGTESTSNVNSIQGSAVDTSSTEPKAKQSTAAYNKTAAESGPSFCVRSYSESSDYVRSMVPVAMSLSAEFLDSFARITDAAQLKWEAEIEAIKASNAGNVATAEPVAGFGATSNNSGALDEQRAAENDTVSDATFNSSARTEASSNSSIVNDKNIFFQAAENLVPMHDVLFDNQLLSAPKVLGKYILHEKRLAYLEWEPTIKQGAVHASAEETEHSLERIKQQQPEQQQQSHKNAFHDDDPFILPQWGLNESDDSLGIWSARPVHGKPRALMLGLGAGFMHSVFLMFPNLIVDSVEVSQDVTRIALEHFDLHRSVCRTLRLVETNAGPQLEAFQLYEPHMSEFEAALLRSATVNNYREHNALFTGSGNGSAHSAHGNSSTTIGSEQRKRSHCRSTVIVGDAWSYLSMIASRVKQFELQRQLRQAPTPTPSLEHRAADKNAPIVAPAHAAFYYDFMLIDMSDSMTTTWHGTVGEGVSQPHAEYYSSVQLIDSIRSLLTPYTGMAVFHLHYDENFERSLESIETVFGKRQLVYSQFKINDNIIIATRDKFLEPSGEHDAALSSSTHGGSHLADAAAAGGGGSNGWQQTCTLGRCVDAEQDSKYASHPAFKAAVHPCSDPVAFAAHIAKFGDLYGFPVQMSHSHKYAPNCNVY